MPSELDRFWSFIDKQGIDDCWSWKGRRSPKGYGHFNLGPGKIVRASRYMLELVLGRKLDPDEQALHSCNNPPCCNPAHLRKGTHEDNMMDRKLSGNDRSGEDHGRAVLTTEQVNEIRSLPKDDLLSHRELASIYGVSHTSIGRILRNERWQKEAR